MPKYIRTQIVDAEPKNASALEWTIGGMIGFADGYVIKYADGEEEWMHAEEFKDQFKPTTGMSFSQALEAMKAGAKITREYWKANGYESGYWSEDMESEDIFANDWMIVEEAPMQK